MRSMIGILFFVAGLASCSKKENTTIPPFVIPDIINGFVTEVNVTPLNITTPDKGSFLLSANNTIYKIDFNVTDQAHSNASFRFAMDTILTDESREYASLGRDVIAYNPVAPNEIDIRFTDGKKIFAQFNSNTSFGGVFGEQLISQWRNSSNPSKPNQKAKDDIKNFVHLYDDRDGAGPGTDPAYLLVTVSKP